jgi:Spy/CpxP family protein refolding chaperone
MPVFVPMMAQQFEQRYDRFVAMDPKRAEAMRKKMLDWTTPEQRAKFEHGMELMNERREQRGLPPMPARGGGFF